MTTSSTPNSFGTAPRDLRGWWLACALLVILSSDAGRALERSIATIFSGLSQVLHLTDHPTNTSGLAISGVLAPKHDETAPVDSSTNRATVTLALPRAARTLEPDSEFAPNRSSRIPSPAHPRAPPR